MKYNLGDGWTVEKIDDSFGIAQLAKIIVFSAKVQSAIDKVLSAKKGIKRFFKLVALARFLDEAFDIFKEAQTIKNELMDLKKHEVVMLGPTVAGAYNIELIQVEGFIKTVLIPLWEIIELINKFRR